MLEDIRVALMKRMFNKKQLMVNSNDNIYPRIRKKLEDAKVGSRVCTLRPNEKLKFKVRLLDDRYNVDLNEKSCSTIGLNWHTMHPYNLMHQLDKTRY